LTRDLYKNPNINVKEWWKKIPNSRDIGVTKYETKFSYQICISCEIDLVDGVCPMCGYGEDKK